MATNQNPQQPKGSGPEPAPQPSQPSQHAQDQISLELERREQELGRREQELQRRERELAAGSRGRTEQPERRPERPIPPFTIELGDEKSRGGLITVDTLKKRLRGRCAPRMGSGVVMQKMPVIPGLRMTINASAREVLIFDPLEKLPALLKEINSVSAEATAIKGAGRFTFVPSVKVSLDADGLKTLLLECRQMVADKRGRIEDGELPTERQVDDMPGRKLFDPWNSGRKPKYEEDAEAYYERLERQSV